MPESKEPEASGKLGALRGSLLSQTQVAQSCKVMGFQPVQNAQSARSLLNRQNRPTCGVRILS